MALQYCISTPWEHIRMAGPYPAFLMATSILSLHQDCIKMNFEATTLAATTFNSAFQPLQSSSG